LSPPLSLSLISFLFLAWHLNDMSLFILTVASFVLVATSVWMTVFHGEVAQSVHELTNVTIGVIVPRVKTTILDYVAVLPQLVCSGGARQSFSCMLGIFLHTFIVMHLEFLSVVTITTMRLVDCSLST
jgi:hypothetical protein